MSANGTAQAALQLQLPSERRKAWHPGPRSRGTKDPVVSGLWSQPRCALPSSLAFRVGFPEGERGAAPAAHSAATAAARPSKGRRLRPPQKMTGWRASTLSRAQVPPRVSARNTVCRPSVSSRPRRPGAARQLPSASWAGLLGCCLHSRLWSLLFILPGSSHEASVRITLEALVPERKRLCCYCSRL